MDKLAPSYGRCEGLLPFRRCVSDESLPLRQVPIPPHAGHKRRNRVRGKKEGHQFIEIGIQVRENAVFERPIAYRAPRAAFIPEIDCPEQYNQPVLAHFPQGLVKLKYQMRVSCDRAGDSLEKGKIAIDCIPVFRKEHFCYPFGAAPVEEKVLHMTRFIGMDKRIIECVAGVSFFERDAYPNQY